MKSFPRCFALWSLAACGAAGAAPEGPRADSPAASASAPAVATAAAPVSLSAQRIYEQARSQLVQIRTLLKGRGSQTSVGSGFVVSPQGHVVTNFHVISEAALEPDTHDLVYVTADGREAPVNILVFDVLHDLALLQVGDPGDPAARRLDALAFRPASLALAQGERLVSLGNPLDVGFAVIEGTYNGLVERSFYPQIFFSGSISSGMSGGPALDQEGRVIGINVARRVDGEQVSFLVPGAFAAALLERGRNAAPMKGMARAEITRQLMMHQAELSERFISQGWKSDTHPHYRLPVPPDRFMRCWGSSEVSKAGGLDFERSDCVMDTRIFVGRFTTGAMSVRHESYDGRRLGALRFAARYSDSFRNEGFSRLRAEDMTKPLCRQDYVNRDGLALRAVVCLRAYRKLPQLYDLSVLVATLDQNQAGVQGRFDAQGLSFDNALKLSRHYLDAYGLLRTGPAAAGGP